MDHGKPIFLTGATGYVGGRLAPRLLSEGWRVRCLARSPRKLNNRFWSEHGNVEVVAGSANDSATLAEAMRGCGVAYFLMHSMESSGDAFRDRDRRLAETFATAAAEAGVERIIYLGGLGEEGPDLSEHLRSRREVAEVLAAGKVPVTTLRAAIIIGSGSASFEILRYLTERLPIMVTPRWVSTECQPIAIRDILRYLVLALHTPATTGKTLDVGGPDILTYRELMQITAEAIGLRRRLIIPVNVLTPTLSSWWIHLITPVNHRIARPLAEGLRNRVVCRDDEAVRLMPFERLPTREAIRLAIGKLRRRDLETWWSDAGPVAGDPDWSGGKVFSDRRRTFVKAAPAEVFRAISRLGGKHGYFGSDVLWQLRGLIDQVLGGPGLRRGRRDAEEIGFGDALDFWRVTEVTPDRSLGLKAEMKLPGEAYLSFSIAPNADDPNRCTLTQVATFKPHGLMGLLYWLLVTPMHGVVFTQMLQGLRRRAESQASNAAAGRGASAVIN